jgi:hypothetical protein
MTKRFDATERIVMADGQTFTLDGYTPSKESDLFIHRRVVSIDPFLMAKIDHSLVHIPSGTNMDSVVPDDCLSMSQVIMFARWLENSCNTELNILKSVKFGELPTATDHRNAVWHIMEKARQYKA